jgi:selenocysteine lyase/cysteine desulfurase
MNSRRKFLKSAAWSGLALPVAGDLLDNRYCLEDLDLTLDDHDFWPQVRRQFPLKKGQTYFNNGTIGAMPGYVLNQVIEDMQYSAVHGAETDYKGNGPQLISGYFDYKDLRSKIGDLINSDYRQIALTQNATFGMSYVGNGLDLQAGDEIINTDQEHGGGFGIWRLMAKRKGCIYKEAKMPVPANDPAQIIDSIFREVTPKTKVIAIPHIISVYGVVMPVKEICAEAKRRGIFTILDGAQAVGQVKVDVQDIGCDAYYSSLHKWLLAPAGNGILYIHKDSIAKIWGTIASYQWDNEEDHGYRLMQNGTGNRSLVVGLNAAIDFHNYIGQDRWLNRIKQLGDYLRAGLQSINRVTIYSSTHPDMCAGITTYAVPGLSGPELQKKMWDTAKLQPRSAGEKRLRHSVHIYNSIEEIDKALEVIDNV